MRQLLTTLLEAETEVEVESALASARLWTNQKRWEWLGALPNNQSVVHAQQTNAEAALVEKVTNSIDALLVRACREEGIDPRGKRAPASMDEAVEHFFTIDDPARFAEDHLMIVGTGERDRLSLSIYDRGEGQLGEDFPSTFCSLIYNQSTSGSNKGGIPFVQGRFNMGGSGILPFCGDTHHMQLIVSRRAPALAGTDDHEWAFTLFRFVDDQSGPGWKYLTIGEGAVPTAGSEPLHLVPSVRARSGTVSNPFGRRVDSGTLIKMYEYKGARANICGDPFFTSLERLLLAPRLPIRVIECREGRKANVMRATIWNTLGRWGESSKLEPEFADGASFSLRLSTDEVIPGEIRVFTADQARKQGRPRRSDAEKPVAGIRALVNGQVHAAEPTNMFRRKRVNLEHIAGSMLVTLDCTRLGAASRGNLLMANREHFREGVLHKDLLARLQDELAKHQGLKELNLRRYQDKLKDATVDEKGLNTLEELLSQTPDLASLFGSIDAGKTANPLDDEGDGGGSYVKAQPFVGLQYPSYFKWKDNSTTARVQLPVDGTCRPTFRTDVENRYLSRRRHRGRIDIIRDAGGLIQSQGSLHNGRFAITLKAKESAVEGDEIDVVVQVTDNHGSGPFVLNVTGKYVASREPAPRRRTDPKDRDPKTPTAPSRPRVNDNAGLEPSAGPLTIETDPTSKLLTLQYNTKSDMLEAARSQRPPAEHVAVEFVFKWGLVLACMGMIDARKRDGSWDEPDTKAHVETAVRDLSRVIVPLCLNLPSKLPPR